MNKIKSIKISTEFSKTPKGRKSPDDGKFTGQLFRETFIEPFFEEYDKFIINLDGLYGCPSSFREESFGGLARKYGEKAVLSKLEFICTDEPPLINVIINDIKKANDKK